MKIFKVFILPFLFTGLITSCEKTATNEFEEANGQVHNKLIKNISVISVQDEDSNKNYALTYNKNNRLTTVSDGTETSVFIYQEEKLANVAGQQDNLNIEELYESPYDAFETGEVEEYDANGNPHIILFFEEDYDYYSGNSEVREYRAEVSYDDTHNPYFFTLEAAGLIEVLDGVRLNFHMSPQVSDIVKARVLFPVNNPSSITYSNEEGEIIHTINIDYDYDDQNYPVSATATSVSLENQETNVYFSNFTYLE
jgi:hypothetical protein